MTNQEWDDCNELSDLRMENAVLKDKLAAALAENTRLAEKVPHWISVKDRLPEDGMDIIVANASTGTEYVSHRDLIFFNESKDAFVPTSYFQEFKFTHWMPLPEPPKEEK